MAARILIVDDENAIRRVLKATLPPAEFEIVESVRGDEAISLVKLSTFDAIVLDMNMPGLSGLSVCRAIRKINVNVPILILTVRDAEDDKVEALDAGADDYMTKPFAVRELTARINALLRRSRRPEVPDTVVKIHDVILCGEQRTFIKRGVPIHLTRTQFDIVELLMRTPGQTVSHRTLLTSVWGAEYRNHLEYLRTYVRQLRKVIEDDPAHPQYLLTVPYGGYRFRDAAPLANPDLPNEGQLDAV
ncbi:response regulator transcription factor [Granulicella paludicola]|jgi:two-component system KDP operon response regulator KdpE|uniref:response regulator transcription factor n=1 Tax=Granulicella paludicola TaxID=474951 RepID=UPI0021E0FBC5|nr:response regulator transcription factor [Granulicella paludicola]